MIYDVPFIPFVVPQRIKDRKISRFSVSETYFLFKGWTTLDEYMRGKVCTPKELWDMAVGSAKHGIIQSCFEDEYVMETKKEFPHGDITLVGMADMIHNDRSHGLEIKTSTKLYAIAKDWHIHQAKMYCTMFEIPVFHIVQPVIRGTETVLKVIGEAKRNDTWFFKQIDKLHAIHEQLKKTVTVNQ